METGNKITTYLLGIDDTDNATSRGTGFRSRHLSALLQEENLGIVSGVTRHQLYFHPDIPYTSQNSSACIELETDCIEKLTEFCEEYVVKECADGSDVGLCIKEKEKVFESVINWGVRAKKEILTQKEAYSIAETENVYLKGFLGTKDGIIGALAAVGLRKFGNDGRFIFLKGKELRDFSGIYSVKELFSLSNIDEIRTKDNVFVSDNDKIYVGEWIRPVHCNNKIAVIVEPVLKNENYEWKIAPKEFIKSISN